MFGESESSEDDERGDNESLADLEISHDASKQALDEVEK
jgi:hypothetical protein